MSNILYLRAIELRAIEMSFTMGKIGSTPTPRFFFSVNTVVAKIQKMLMQPLLYLIIKKKEKKRKILSKTFF